MKWLSDLFSASSDASMKRLVALASFVTAIFYTFMPSPDVAVLAVWIGSGTTLLGVAAITKT